MKIHIVRDYEGVWEAAYVEHELVLEGHRLHWPEILRKLGFEVYEREADFEATTSAPPTLAGVVFRGSVCLRCEEEIEVTDIPLCETCQVEDE